jgi:hypothetical protein
MLHITPLIDSADLLLDYIMDDDVLMVCPQHCSVQGTKAKKEKKWAFFAKLESGSTLTLQLIVQKGMTLLWLLSRHGERHDVNDKDIIGIKVCLTGKEKVFWIFDRILGS